MNANVFLECIQVVGMTPCYFLVSRTVFTAKAQKCSSEYDDYVSETIGNHSVFDQVLDFFSGTVSTLCFSLPRSR